MIFISILFVISFTLNVILTLMLKNSKTLTKELTLKVKILSDYADNTLEVKEVANRVKQTLVNEKPSNVLQELASFTSEVVDATPKKPRKPRRKRKPNTPKD